MIARIADRYNQALRRFGPWPNVEGVDLDAWSKGAFRPRHDYFVGTAFPTETGQQRIGEYVAAVVAESGVLEMERSVDATGEPARRP